MAENLNDNVSLLAQLAAERVQMDPVHPARLLRPSPHRPMEERIFDGVRKVALPAHGADGEIHQALAGVGVPVLDAEPVRGDILFLRVPAGAQPLRSVMHLIAGDVHKFGGALYMAGQVQGRLMAAGFGGIAPIYGEGLLDSLALAPMSEDGVPAHVFLVPPYYLANPDKASSDSFVSGMHYELHETGVFSDAQLELLLAQTDAGIRDYGYERQS